MFLISEPVASSIIVVDALGDASMSEIARVTGRPLSTIQRAVDRLIGTQALRRSAPRGPLSFDPHAPRTALCEMAEWSLGAKRVSELRRAAIGSARAHAVPPTVRDQQIRDAWPGVIDSIVERFEPAQVILFGSQARGDATAGSDVDLLVVFDSVDDRRERRIGISRLLRDVPFAKDVLVASSQDVAQAWPGTAIANAVHEGIVVYER